MSVFNEPTKWQTSLVNSGDANTIPQSTPVGTGKASFKDGFPQITQIPLSAGGIAPDRKDFNGLFKILGDWIFFNQNGGVSTYSESFDYVAGRVVLYNGNLYKCIQANGVSSTVVTPDSGNEYWQRLDNYVRSVNGVNADASGNVTIQASCIPDYKSGIRVGPLSQGQAWKAPADGILISGVKAPAGGAFLSHTKANDTIETYSVADNWVIYNDASAGDDDFQTATAIVGKGETLYQTKAVVDHNFGIIMFYPFK